MLAQLYCVDGETAGLRRDVKHSGWPGPLGRGLVQGRILHLDRTKLALEQVEGAAAGGCASRPRDFTPVTHHADW